MKVFRVGYSVNGNQMNACIVADDAEKAVNFISKVLRAPINVTTIENMGDVHGIGDEIIERILEKYGTKVPTPKKTKEVDAPLYDEEGEKPKRTRGKRMK